MKNVMIGIGLYLMLVALLLFWANMSASKFIYVDF